MVQKGPGYEVVDSSVKTTLPSNGIQSYLSSLQPYKAGRRLRNLGSNPDSKRMSDNDGPSFIFWFNSIRNATKFKPYCPDPKNIIRLLLLLTTSLTYISISHLLSLTPGPYVMYALTGSIVTEMVGIDVEFVLDVTVPLLEAISITALLVAEHRRVRDLAAAIAAIGFRSGCRAVSDRGFPSRWEELFRLPALRFWTIRSTIIIIWFNSVACRCTGHNARMTGEIHVPRLRVHPRGHMGK